jgi:uncharacterized membrane protein YeaQ/YmgE (transglycosylase-associated protein family)
MTILNGLFLLLIAGVCGVAGRAIVGDTRGGIPVSVGVGLVGALLGVWLGCVLALPTIFVIDPTGTPFSVVWAVVGSVMCTLILSAVRRPGRHHP